MKSAARFGSFYIRSALLLLFSASISFGQGFPTSDEVSTLAIRVRAADGTNLPGFPFVELFREDRRIDYGSCDNKGEYTFYNLEEEIYRVRVSLAGFAPDVQEVHLQGGVVQNIYVDLQRKEQLGPSPLTIQELTMARQLRAKGDWRGAIQHMKRAVEDSPRFVVAHVELGIYYWQNEQLNAAQKSLETAIEIAPNLLPAYLNLAEILARKGDVEGVRDVCSRGSEAHSDEPPATNGSAKQKGSSRHSESSDRAEDLLRDVARATGGRVWYAKTSAELEEMETRYLLSYQLVGAPEEGWHELEVRLKKQKGETIRARLGYMVMPTEK